MNSNPLRVGLIGLGAIARGEHLPAWLALPDVTITAIADPSVAAVQRVSALVPGAKTFADWQELLQTEELDAVDICTPNRMHAPIAFAALQRGLYVLCEKPLATSVGEVQALRELAGRGNQWVMTAQNCRFRRVSQQLKTLIDAGRLGDVYYSRAQWLRRRRVPVNSTFIDPNLSGGGPCFDIGVHVLDLACWFMGFPLPVSVSANMGIFLANRPDLTGEWGDWDRAAFGVEDFATAYVRFSNGATLTLETSWLGFQPEAEKIEVQCFGTQGGIVWPDGKFVSESKRVPTTLTLDDVDDKMAYFNEISAFVTAVREGLPNPVPMEQTLAVTRILEACYESARLRREIVL